MLRSIDPRPFRSVDSLDASVREHCECLLRSPQLDASVRSRAFLQFVVGETLEGRGEQLNQAAIATAVFGRGRDFDAVLDPIVRVQAGRLRRALERFYLLPGQAHPVSITLPKGSYTPVFRVSEPAAPAEHVLSALNDESDTSGFWREVMIACGLGHLGLVREARIRVAELLVAEPDLRTRGARLIGCYVKSAGLRATIIEGLAKGGLKLE